MDYEMNATHLAKYKKYAEEYVKKLGLYQWERSYIFKDFDGAQAACGCNRDGRLAILTLATEWAEDKPTDVALKAAAKHEVLELLLWDMCELHKDPRTTDTEINAVRHEVIRRLETIIP